MGLDTVELVMTVEEAFDISIPDADAEKIMTVGDLYRYVLSKVGGAEGEPPPCLTGAAFYRLRRGLIRCLRVERNGVRPQSLIDDVIPEANRRSEWQRLGENLGWKLPGLVRPAWVWPLFLGLLLAWLVAVLLTWGLLAGFGVEAMIPTAVGFLIGAWLLGAVVYEYTQRLATCFPARTVRGMVALILGQNFATIRNRDQVGGNRHEVWEALKVIIIAQTGASPDAVTESASFVYDLGMD